MADSELAPLLDVAWSALDHRAARAHVERLGWRLCGVGDWAYAFRSPGGSSVARISPFEPAYGYFVDLCRRCSGNRHVPRVDIAVPLEGGGHLTVMEFLTRPDKGSVDEFLRRWHSLEEADNDIRVLRKEVSALDTWGRENVRWWGQVDLGERHVLLSADGNLKLIDLFFVTGHLLEEELVRDPRAFRQHMSPDRCRYLLDIPDLQDDSNSEERLARIRGALAIMQTAS